MRPLLLGAGLPPLLHEFNKADGATEPDYALLCFVKCIEYVSATVVRVRQYEDVRRRLLCKGALDPDAEFIDDLVSVVEENRVFAKDSEALRLAIEKCCDARTLSPLSRTCIPSLASLKIDAKQSDRQVAMKELAACFSATRNRIAHAKANYEATGKECPDEQLEQLVECARLAAEQCIRWFGDLAPKFRRV